LVDMRATARRRKCPATEVKVTSAGLIRTVWSTRVFRLLTWCCVISLAVLTLLPKEEMGADRPADRP
jgi:hypothetical protein